MSIKINIKYFLLLFILKIMASLNLVAFEYGKQVATQMRSALSPVFKRSNALNLRVCPTVTFPLDAKTKF